MASFFHIAGRIRSQQWDDEWVQELFWHLPDDLLHTFACDCAKHALDRETEKGRPPIGRVWEIIRTKRKWIKGNVRDEELEAIFKRVHREVGHPELHADKANASEAAIDAAFEASLLDPMDAATGASWAAARSYAIDTREATGAKERQWQLDRLASLCEFWGQHGDHVVYMLPDL